MCAVYNTSKTNLALVGLDAPDVLGVLRDGTVGGELAHTGNGVDGLLDPGGLRVQEQALSMNERLSDDRIMFMLCLLFTNN